MNYRIIIISLISLILFGCSEYRPNEQLQAIYEMSGRNPEEALAVLDSIDYHLLSEADRHYYDFLKVKASDKAYVKHTSDSLILSVMKYYSSGKPDSIYQEALYLGGRVYSDLGDYPTALQYFNKVLDEMSGKKDVDLNRKASVLSQTGRLLTNISLYDEAIPYIKESIEIGEAMGDTVNMVYDLQLLGGTYLRAKKYSEADKCLQKAIILGERLPMSIQAISRMYLAAVKKGEGQYQSALNIIRGTENQVRPITRNGALAYAATIYQANDILDTAYLFAHELIHSRDSTYREIGYQVLLSPELRSYSSLDTIDEYISDYRRLLESYYDSNASTLAVNQQTLYNYQTHERARRETESFNQKLMNTLAVSFIMLLLLIAVILYFMNKNKKTLIELHIAKDNLNQLKQNIGTTDGGQKDKIPSEINEESQSKETPADLSSLNNASEPSENGGKESSDKELLTDTVKSLNETNQMRERLKNDLLSLYESNPKIALNQNIADSEAYINLQELIKEGRELPYEDALWGELEKAVTAASPNFINNLRLLTQSRLTSVDLHTALLIKCQVLPSQMSVLLRRTMGAIVSRRDSLCLKIFDKRMGTKVIDGIIRLM